MNRILIAAFAIGLALRAFGAELPEVAQSPNADGGKGSPSSSSQALPEPPQSSNADDERESGSSGWSYAPRGSDVLWASARNDHGSLGQYCNTEMHFCVWLLMLRGVACEEGGEHPVLLNTDNLAAAQTLRCVGTIAGRGATFAFTNFQEIDAAVRSAEQLAIAIPEEGDSIVVTHFPLTGAVAVLDRMREALAERSSSDDAEGSVEDSNDKHRSQTPTRDRAGVYMNSA